MSIYDFSPKMISGEIVNLDDYKDKIILIVNTASKCGFTPQYKDLEELYKKYKDQGLIILGFPCDQFKNQEPGSNEEILEFCQINYGVTFPIFEKIEVNGENQDPLFRYLKSKKTFEGFDKDHKLTTVIKGIVFLNDPGYKTNSDIKWNFTKFLVGKNGEVLERFEPTKNMDIVEEKIKILL